MAAKVKLGVQDIKILLLLILGCAIMALGIGVFHVPNKIAAGGLTGLATVIFHLTGKPVGLVTLLLNIPLFLIGIKFVGTTFGIRSLAATVLLSVMIDLAALLPPITDDLLLGSLVGGALMGLGLGLILRQEATTGGTDLAAKIIHRFSPVITIAKILLLIDALVVLLASFTFKSYELGLYAIISLVVTTKIIDMIAVGIDYMKAAQIISPQSRRIAQRLITELDRGVTGLRGEGMYTGDAREVLVCVLRPREVPRLKKIVKEEDPLAFIFLSDVREVLGEGFSSHE